MKPILKTLGDRVWWAWNCLPRRADGKPDDYLSIEREHGISNGTISQLIKGDRVDVRGATLAKLSAALRVSPAWLLERHGPDPRLTGEPIGRETERKALGLSGSGEMAKVNLTNLSRALIFLEGEVSDEVARAVMTEADGREDDRTPREWVAIIEDKERARTSSGGSDTRRLYPRPKRVSVRPKTPPHKR